MGSAAHVVGPEAPLVGRRAEDEELHLGAGHEREAVAAGPFEVATQHLAGIAGERLARGQADVAEHAGDRGALGVFAPARPGPAHVAGADPGEQLEGGRVGHGQHVGLLHPGVALDHRAVEHHALLEGLVQLGRRDRERLEEALHVGEPQPYEAHAPFLDRAQHRAPVWALMSAILPGPPSRATGRSDGGGLIRAASSPAAHTLLTPGPDPGSCSDDWPWSQPDDRGEVAG